MNKHRVFCYGTLKRGFGNHGLLSKADYVGNAVTKGVMYNLGPFPAVSLHGDNQIHGELYDVNDTTLTMLDRLEGVPTLYQREKVETSEGPAWIYTMDRDFDMYNYSVVKNGVWEGSTNVR